ncbi:LysM peptidoglycan-binding domain-containing protein [Jannaschia marina]|uniref:LysM peptidoglycan-binding domain-containing protein n=1 Tax=Jannaschia marina TaxID=2741674 RepID=UPI0015C6B807|nr:transporter substrate-binding domain-containing protein [Jannaschia marina]
MKYTLSTVFICSSFLMPSEVSAQAISCGQDYTVRSGDFLSGIAQRAYGSPESFSLIYNANAETIGRDPALIRVGQKLIIPCLSEEIGESTASAENIRREQTTEALPGPSQNRPIRVLTGTGWAPFADEDQAQGGMLTEITNLALAEANGNPDYQIDFINDGGAHLTPLLTDHAYDFSIGWSRPNCELLDQLNDDSQFRCNNFNWTEPLYRQIIAYYTIGGITEYTEHSQLVGKSLCRAEGFSTAMIEEVGLREPEISIVRRPDSLGCLEAVIEGEVDVAVVATDAAEPMLSNLEDPSSIMFHEQLSYVSPIRALIAKTHPQSEELVATFNSGLTQIKDSGVWFTTVRRHLEEFNASYSE